MFRPVIFQKPKVNGPQVTLHEQDSRCPVPKRDEDEDANEGEHAADEKLTDDENHDARRRHQDKPPRLEEAKDNKDPKKSRWWRKAIDVILIISLLVTIVFTLIWLFVGLG